MTERPSGLDLLRARLGSVLERGLRSLGKPGARRRGVVTRSSLFVVLTVCAVVLARAPFLAHNPDWGPMLTTEHCWNMTDPFMYEQRRAVAPDEELPFWVVNYAQMKSHYHGGSELMSHLVRVASLGFSPTTVLPNKIVGLVFTALTIGLLAWGLRRIWPVNRWNALVPLFLLTVPPSLLLWMTLLPRGHYFETHLFYALFLPFMVSEAEERTTPVRLVLLGALGGYAVVYTFSNAVFLTAFVCLWFVEHVLFALPRGWIATARGLSKWIRFSTLSSVPAGVVLVVSGKVQLILERVFTENPKTWEILLGSREPVLDGLGGATLDSGRWISPASWWTSARQHGWQLFSTTGNSVLRPPDDDLAVVAAVAVAIPLTAGMLYLLARLFTTLARGSDGLSNREDRFVFLNGVMLVGFLLAYVVFEPLYWYLVPAYVPIFVGTGVLFGRVLRHRSRGVRVAGALLALAASSSLCVGWVDHYHRNVRGLRNVPAVGLCETARLEGYFQEINTGDPMPARSFLGHAATPNFARIQGQRRCTAVYPTDPDVCAYVGYLFDGEPDVDTVPCLEAPEPERVLCAQAHGARLVAFREYDDEGIELGCAVFDGELRDACVSGANQGVMTRGVEDHVHTIANLCRESFQDAPLRSTCIEQVAALMYGAPPLPPAPDSPSTECAAWPRSWRGLCARAERLDRESRASGSPRSCESVYLERFADELPSSGRLHYSQCLHLTSHSLYPWCAIGVARQRGDVECAWAGTSSVTDRWWW